MPKPRTPSPPPPKGDEDPIWGDLFNIGRLAPIPTPPPETPAAPAPKIKAPARQRKSAAKQEK
jgi:hypothetical protein